MRYRKIIISPEFFMGMMETGTESHFRCVEGLPPGTKFCYSIPDTIRGIWIVVEHESFTPLKDGDYIPHIDYPTFEKVR